VSALPPSVARLVSARLDRLSKNGQYSDYLPGLNGQTILARTQDGIHLSTDGASLAATLVLQAMNKDWHLTP